MYDNVLPVQYELMENKKDYAMASVINTAGSSIAKPGFKIIVSENKIIFGTLGSPNLDNVVMKEGMKSIENKAPKVLKIALDKDNKDCDYSMNTTCGGIIELFIEPYLHRSQLIILHESNDDMLLKSLYELSPFIDMDLRAYNINDDSEKNNLTKDEYSDAYVLFITKSVKELDFLEFFLKKELKYMAIVASKNRFKSDIDILKKRNIDLDTTKIKCPAGLDINAISVNEIALSIAAELIKEKNQKT